METDFIQELKDKGLLLYHFIRGSQSQGVATATSDTDHGFIYIAPHQQLLGLGFDYQDQIASEKMDDTGYEIRKYMQLLIKSNPTALESLFVDDKFVLYEHPLMTEIKKYKDKFLTKACFKPILGYSYEQINKCRGLHKKFLVEDFERRGVLDFVYTFYKQGSSKIQNWLEYRGMKQNYCGLVNIPNMKDMYALFYDWGNHFLNEGITKAKLIGCNDTLIIAEASGKTMTDIVFQMKKGDKKMGEIYKEACLGNMYRFILEKYKLSSYSEFAEWFNNQKPIGYRGLVNAAESSNELRLSSVEKDVLPICHVSYNKDGYIQHCREYRELQEWKKNRNPQRYMENRGKMFDRKNVAHAVRLIHMGLEIARDGKFIVDRTGIDRDFILSIRQGNTSYEEIIKYISGKKEEMEEAMKNSTLPDEIDVNFVNDLLIKIRKEFYHLS